MTSATRVISLLLLMASTAMLSAADVPEEQWGERVVDAWASAADDEAVRRIVSVPDDSLPLENRDREAQLQTNDALADGWAFAHAGYTFQLPRDVEKVSVLDSQSFVREKEDHAFRAEAPGLKITWLDGDALAGSGTAAIDAVDKQAFHERMANATGASEREVEIAELMAVQELELYTPEELFVMVHCISPDHVRRETDFSLLVQYSLLLHARSSASPRQGPLWKIGTQQGAVYVTLWGKAEMRRYLAAAFDQEGQSLWSMRVQIDDEGDYRGVSGRALVAALVKGKLVGAMSFGGVVAGRTREAGERVPPGPTPEPEA